MLDPGAELAPDDERLQLGEGARHPPKLEPSPASVVFPGSLTKTPPHHVIVAGPHPKTVASQITAFIAANLLDPGASSAPDDLLPLIGMSPLEKSLLSALARASHDYRLIENGDRIMVAVSGGKDSLCLLHLLRQIQRRAPFDFEIVAVTLDQGQPGFAA